MGDAARLQDAPELRERGEWSVDIDEGIAGDDSIYRGGRQRQPVVQDKMRRHAMGEARGRCLLPRSCDELGVDIERVHMAGRSDPSGKLDCRMAGAAAEIRDRLT